MRRLEVSGAVRPIYGSLGVKRLNTVIVSALSYFLKVTDLPIVWTENVNMQIVCPGKEIFFVLYFVVLMTFRSKVFWRIYLDFFFRTKVEIWKFGLRPFGMWPNLMKLYCSIFQTAAFLIRLHDSMATKSHTEIWKFSERRLRYKTALFMYGATLHIVMDDLIAVK